MKNIILAVAIAASVGVAPALPAFANSKLALAFETHAAFFSKETKQAKEIDPQVFVADPAAPAATGPQGIVHIAKFRPAFTDQAPATPVFTAQGTPLGFTLGAWLGAKGELSITPESDGTAKVVAAFTGLQPNGVYSLFENHFDQKPIGFTPLDGTGTNNSFSADATGAGEITLTAPTMPTDVNAVLLVYHSDGKTHGVSRGQIGVNAHHQLIAKVP